MLLSFRLPQVLGGTSGWSVNQGSLRCATIGAAVFMRAELLCAKITERRERFAGFCHRTTTRGHEDSA